MIFWTIFIVALALAVLTSLKGWAWVRSRGKAVAATVEREGLRAATRARSTLESELDDFVQDAHKVWPSIKGLPLFYIAIVTLTCMVALNVKFGWDRGGHEVSLATIVFILLFSTADVALAVLAVRGDRGTGAWYEFKRDDRKPGERMLIGVFTVMSIFVVIGSTGDVSSQSTARNKVEQSGWQEVQRQLDQKTKLRDELVSRRVANGGMSRESLEVRAKEAKDASDREAERVRCGKKCEELKSEAVKWEAQAADARKEDQLTEEIAVLHGKLKGADTIRDGSDPFEDFSSYAGMSGGQFNKWLFILFGTAFALGNTVLWLLVGDEAGKVRAIEYRRRGEIADSERNTLGLPPKYTAPLEAQALLAPPKAEGAGDTIIVQVSAAEDMRRRFANDADLLEVDRLFGSLVDPSEGGVVTIAELYKAYQVSKLRTDPNSRYMTQPTMAAKLFTIAANRDDVKVTSDGRITGWTIKKLAAAAE